VTLIVDVASDGVRAPLGRERVMTIVRTVLEAEEVDDALISVAFVTRRAMAALNRRHLGRTGPTDVIAFGLARTDAKLPVIGDIYIAPEVARGQAHEHGVGVREEVARLAVHGTLHVLGHDHPEGGGRTTSRMWERQEALLAKALRKVSG
jgi:probable rRNA maturation factor